MGRSLKGSLRERGAKWYASVPAEKGSLRRIEHGFESEQEAQRWLDAARAAVEAGHSAPEPDSFRLNPGNAVVRASVRPPAFPEAARQWRNMAYEELRRGQPERARRIDDIIRLHLVPWFGPRTSSISDLEDSGHLLTRLFVLHLAGRRVETDIPSSSVLMSGHLSLAETAKHLGKSEQTVRRYWLDGRFPNAQRKPGSTKILIPARDVENLELRRDNQRRTGLSKSYSNDILWVLRQVIGYAMANLRFKTGADAENTDGVERGST